MTKILLTLTTLLMFGCTTGDYESRENGPGCQPTTSPASAPDASVEPGIRICEEGETPNPCATPPDQCWICNPCPGMDCGCPEFDCD